MRRDFRGVGGKSLCKAKRFRHEPGLVRPEPRQRTSVPRDRLYIKETPRSKLVGQNRLQAVSKPLPLTAYCSPLTFWLSPPNVYLTLQHMAQSMHEAISSRVGSGLPAERSAGQRLPAWSAWKRTESRGTAAVNHELLSATRSAWSPQFRRWLPWPRFT